ERPSRAGARGVAAGAAEPRLVPPAPAAIGGRRLEPSPLVRRPRQLLQPPARTLPRAARPRPPPAPPPAPPRPARRRAAAAATQRALPLHREQRALADRRGTAPGGRRRPRGCVQRRQPSEGSPPERRARAAGARRRHLGPPAEGSPLVPPPALRLRR